MMGYYTLQPYSLTDPALRYLNQKNIATNLVHISA